MAQTNVEVLNKHMSIPYTNIAQKHVKVLAREIPAGDAARRGLAEQLARKADVI